VVLGPWRRDRTLEVVDHSVLIVDELPDLPVPGLSKVHVVSQNSGYPIT